MARQFRVLLLMRSKTMSKNNDIKTALPKLRFPEFRSAEVWSPKIIGDLIDAQSSQLALGKLNFVDAGFPVYGADGMIGFLSSYNQSNNYISIVKDGSGVGRLSLCRKESSVLSTLQYLVSKDEEKYCLDYLYYLLQNVDFKEYVKGSGIPHIYYKDYKHHNVVLPSSTIEQTKIAKCLSSLDDAISGVSDKIEALKEYKKGLMQQLFPAEGKTTPAFRFPEFQDSGEWIETTLGAELNYENGKAHENGIVIDGHYVVVNSKFISTDGAVRKYTNEPFCIAKERDILMVLSDVPNGRAIAKCFFVDESDRYTVNQRVCKLTTKGVDSKFLYYILNRNGYFLSFDDGVKQTNLKKDDVLKCPLNIPTDPDEQKKIAATLSSLDNLISSSIDRQEQLKAHKNGLMQQLFPNLNE